MNNIILDFRYNYTRGDRFGAQEVVYQYDTGRVIEAYVPVEEDGFVLNIGWESDPVLSVIQADSVEAAEEGGYKILATIPDSILTKHGNLLVYIIAGDGDTDMVITTYEGVVTVRSKAVAEDYIPPDEPSMSILERCAIAANAAENAQGAAETAQGGSEASALKSEGYAIGEQDGTPVSSGDYFQNNAKYYSEQASDEADAADASALKAEGYSVGKQNGTDVGSGSDYYHNNAKYYAEQAAESAAAFVIDDTLTQQGEAADAKATGDAISALNSKLGSSRTLLTSGSHTNSTIADTNCTFTLTSPKMVEVYNDYTNSKPLYVAIATKSSSSVYSVISSGTSDATTSATVGRISAQAYLTPGTYTILAKSASTSSNNVGVYVYS